MAINQITGELDKFLEKHKEPKLAQEEIVI